MHKEKGNNTQRKSDSTVSNDKTNEKLEKDIQDLEKSGSPKVKITDKVLGGLPLVVELEISSKEHEELAKV